MRNFGKSANFISAKVLLQLYIYPFPLISLLLLPIFSLYTAINVEIIETIFEVIPAIENTQILYISHKK